MKDLYGIVGDRVHGEGQRQKQFPPLRYGMTNKEMSATAEADSFAALRNDKKNCNRNCNGKGKSKSKSKMRGFFASLRMTNKKVDA
jgi:hypothetical protein